MTSMLKKADPAKAWKWFRAMGSPKMVLAPMVDQSELPFRMMSRKYGAELCFTPMLHSLIWQKSQVYRKEQFQTCPEDKPLIAQMCGNDKHALLELALQLQESGVDAVDLNLGCPQGIARRGNYGAFLLEDQDTVVDIVSHLYQKLDIPVTCKIRILLTGEDDTISYCKRLQEAGCSLITVHGRTRNQKHHQTGTNNFEFIKRVKDELDIPVYANGGIQTYEDIQKCLEVTGCDGVMVAEGSLSNPLIFSQKESKHPLEIAKEYLEFYHKYPGETPPKYIRPHLFKILHRQLAKFTDVRAKLGKVYAVDDIQKVLIALEAEEKNSGGTFDELYGEIPTWYDRWRTHNLKNMPGRKKRGEKKGTKKDETASMKKQKMEKGDQKETDEDEVANQIFDTVSSS